MKTINILGRASLAINARDGVLDCRLSGTLSTDDVGQLVLAIADAANEARAMAVLLDVVASDLDAHMERLRSEVLGYALTTANWRPLALLVDSSALHVWFGLAQQLAARGLVTGVFNDRSLAWAYVQGHGPLWLADRRWTGQENRPAAAPGQSARTQPVARRRF